MEEYQEFRVGVENDIYIMMKNASIEFSSDSSTNNNQESSSNSNSEVSDSL